MSEVKSKPYNLGISLSSYHFSYDDGKLVGISKQNDNKKFEPVDPSTNEFTEIANTDESLDAFNYAIYGDKDKVKSIETASAEELANFYAQKKKKTDNASVEPPQSAEFTTPQNVASAYKSESQSYTLGLKTSEKDIMAYPLDIDPNQDHFKIMRYNYVRDGRNQSKGPYQAKNRSGEVENVAGDSVRGSELMGSILLPMPKATDVNGVEWGKSELTISGLAALGVAKGAVDTAGEVINSFKRGTGVVPAVGAIDVGVRRAKQLIQDRTGLTNTEGSDASQFGQAMGISAITKLAGSALGTELDADTFLARTGGKVLNPNAEMLFQGPVIRDFAFSFIMIARSKKEGDEIRRIIRFLKVGMAPKFSTTTFLKAPDIFTLAYKRGKGEKDVLNTVNRFNPGGLALTTMNVDYAPNSYWSAYTDSQPVAVKMDLNFTELRPLYQSDQESTDRRSVGY